MAGGEAGRGSGSVQEEAYKRVIHVGMTEPVGCGGEPPLLALGPASGPAETQISLQFHHRPSSAVVKISRKNFCMYRILNIIYLKKKFRDGCNFTSRI